MSAHDTVESRCAAIVAEHTERLARQTAIGRAARKVARMTRGDGALDAPEAEPLPPLPESVPVALSSEGYAFLHSTAVRSAAKGRYLGHAVKRDVGDPIPAPRSIEDDETAHDAIGMAWHWAVRHARETIELRLVRAIARRLGARRAQHRLRERSGLVDVTDSTIPVDAQTMTLRELLAAVPPARRAMAALKLREFEARPRKGGRPLAVDPAPSTARRHAARARAAERGEVHVYREHGDGMAAVACCAAERVDLFRANAQNCLAPV